MDAIAPWTYRRCPCGDRACKSYRLSVQSSSGMLDEEDARLACASPELLAALRGMVAQTDALGARGVMGIPYENAKAAIAKAVL